MSLTDTAIKKAKAAAKPVKLSDSKGMYLLVSPTGSKLWRWKYRVLGKEKVMALGAYLNFVWPQTLEVLDLDVPPPSKGKKAAKQSGIFNKEHPLTLESRAGVGKMDREI